MKQGTKRSNLGLYGCEGGPSQRPRRGGRVSRGERNSIFKLREKGNPEDEQGKRSHLTLCKDWVLRRFDLERARNFCWRGRKGGHGLKDEDQK